MADNDQNISQGEDVESEETQAEETDTSDTSSSEKETAQDSKESASTADTEESEEQSVPYSRFKEVNERARKAEELEAKVAELEGQLKPKDPNTEAVKEQLKPILDELGYVSKDELKQIDEDKFVQSELSRLEKTFDGKDGRPKFGRDEVVDFALDKRIGDLETAYKQLHEKDILDWHVKRAIAKSKGILTESSDGSGSQGAGTPDEDLKGSIAKGDKKALRTYLKRAARRAPKAGG